MDNILLYLITGGEKMNIGALVQQKIKDENQTKTWLAESLSISYSTLHQKISNDTFSAKELLQISRLLDIDLKILSESYNFDENSIESGYGKYDLSKMNCSERCNVQYAEMERYKNGGIFIDENFSNGFKLYMPKGIANELTNSRYYLMKVIADKMYKNNEFISKVYDDYSSKIAVDIVKEEQDKLAKAYVILNRLFDTMD